MTTGPRIGCLFSGYGGLSMAVQQVYGGTHSWFCEFDPAPSRILAHHWPDVPNLQDITKVDWSTVEPVDVLTGGFPCQDVSVAGRRAGMRDGTRSGLWAHMRTAIDQLRPGLVVIENVGGLFSAEANRIVEPCEYHMGDADGGGHTVLLRAADAVLGDLASLGYDAEWVALRASDVGAPHGRLRVFITAHPADTSGRRGGGRGTVPSAGEAGESHAPTLRADPRPGASGDAPGVTLLPTPTSWEQRGDPATDHRNLLPLVVQRLLPTPTVNDMGAAYTPDQWDEWTDRMREAHGNGNGHGKSLSVEALRMLPTPSAALATMGGGRDPEERRDGNHSITLKDAIEGGPDSPSPILPTPTASEGRGRRASSATREGGPSLSDAVDRFGPYAPAIARWEQIIGRPAPEPTEPGKTRPRLSARFVEWLMGLPDGHVTGVGLTRNQELKALGNGVVPQQAATALTHLDHVRSTTP